MNVRIILSSALFLLLIIAGILLHRTGKPYNSLVFAAHKIFTIAIIILMTLVFVNFMKIAYPPNSFKFILGLAAFAIIGLIVSGGMMSLDKGQGLMLIFHRVFSGIIIVAFPLLIYMIYNTKQLNI